MKSFKVVSIEAQKYC